MREGSVTQWKKTDAAVPDRNAPGRGYSSSESPSLLFVAPAHPAGTRSELT